MASCKTFFQIAAFLTLILGLLLYHPLHEDLDDKALMRFAYGIDNIFKYVGDFEEWRGKNRWLTERVMFETIAALTKEPLEEGIQERKEVFNNVNVHIFEPKVPSTEARPAFIYMHGGGFTFGSSETHRNLADILAKKLQIMVVSVNYRLTPEYHYPAQINDVLAVMNYVYENADELGIDQHNIGIGGDSAGGALAAGATLKLRDISSLIKLKYQVLLYPYVQGLSVDLPSHEANEWHTFHFLKQKIIAEFTTMYVGADIKLSKYVQEGNHTSPDIWNEYGHLVNPKLLSLEYIPSGYNMEKFGSNRLKEKDHGISKESMNILTDPYAFPLMAQSLRNLPPAFVLTCQLDPIRDDGLLYVQRLRKDGVTVEHYHDNHGFHGMMSLTKGQLVAQAAVDAADAIADYMEKMKKS